MTDSRGAAATVINNVHLGAPLVNKYQLKSADKRSERVRRVLVILNRGSDMKGAAVWDGWWLGEGPW